MRRPKPPKKIKHVELWLSNERWLYIVDPNDGAILCSDDGSHVKYGKGDLAPWGEYMRLRSRVDNFAEIQWFTHEFLGELK